MKCNGCGSLMTLDRSETGKSSSSEWYQCSLCGKVRLKCSKTSLMASSEDYSQQAGNSEVAGFDAMHPPLVSGY